MLPGCTRAEMRASGVAPQGLVRKITHGNEVSYDKRKGALAGRGS